MTVRQLTNLWSWHWNRICIRKHEINSMYIRLQSPIQTYQLHLLLVVNDVNSIGTNLMEAL